jgi:broad specificity phosphatase PhoE
METQTVKILLMRHSESVYNRIQYDWKDSNGYERSHPEKEEFRFLNNDQIVDALLTPHGTKQVNSC